MELRGIYSEIKICVYSELRFCWETNTGDPQRKKSSPPVDTFSPWWMMLSWQSRFRNGNQGTNGLVLFIKIPFKGEKKSQNPKDCIWNQQNLAVLICSLGSKENRFALCLRCCDIRVLEVLEAILTRVACYWKVHTGGWVCSLFAKWPIFFVSHRLELGTVCFWRAAEMGWGFWIALWGLSTVQGTGYLSLPPDCLSS